MADLMQIAILIIVVILIIVLLKFLIGLAFILPEAHALSMVAHSREGLTAWNIMMNVRNDGNLL